MSRVAVVGIGAMGSRIARRLLDARHEVLVWNRHADRLGPLLDSGAARATSPAAAAARAEVVVTMVSDPAALEAVTEGASGIAAGAGEHLTMIEMSTVGPSAVKRLASVLPAGSFLLDAPVLGSIAAAEAGSLRIFVGGSASVYARWTPLLSVLGSPRHVGPLGSGAAAKLVANASIFGVNGILGEVLALSAELGLSREAAYQVLATTPLAEQAERRRPSLEADDDPARFRLELAHKDALLIAEAASVGGVDVRLLTGAGQWLADAYEAGWGNRDYTAILGWIQQARRTHPCDTG
jgi:3-hydroxyisobutyrate dehydrogenase-like beta-hydroxyacid dehydrogenase